MAPILLVALTGIFVSLAVLAGFVAWSMRERRRLSVLGVRVAVTTGVLASAGVLTYEGFGVEAIFWMDGELLTARRFDTRALAVQ